MAIAVFSWELVIECSNCGTGINLADGNHDEEGQISKPIFNNKWSDLAGEEIHCDGCDHETVISEVIY